MKSANGSPGWYENGPRSNRTIEFGRRKLVVSRWHCMHTSICRSALSRAGFTIAFRTSSMLAIVNRSEEHTSELQSRSDLVCRLLLEKKKHKKHIIKTA